MQEKVIDSEMHGFRDVFFSKGWRVAYADYNPLGNDIAAIHKIEKHLETEEVFYLLKGSVCLVTAGQGEAIGPLICHYLKEGTLYVVDKGEWHVGVFHPGSAVLIVENEAESLSNSYELCSKDRESLKKIFI
ncbi:MAG: hypothetical protein GX626_07335 [Spirochaetales bacterium]|nr:hypothetical protein [Spirochaetales bacterium]